DSGKFTFVPGASAGNATFTYTVKDNGLQGANALGQDTSTAATYRIAVTATPPAPPTSTGPTFHINENTPRTLTTADFGYSGQSSFFSVFIDSASLNGGRLIGP